jgi:NADP-dependent aldehyde dehydrogenase
VIEQNIHEVLVNANNAFNELKQYSPSHKAAFLKTIAAEIEALGDSLLEQAAEETNLPIERLKGERARTILQLHLFAEMLQEGSWVEAVIDTAIPERTPPKPNIRRMLFPIGPIVVFGASNFPFAYSTAGGDTASALAAGCSVIVKAHPAHLNTSKMVFQAIQKAIKINNMPQHIVQHVTETSFEAGKVLVQHPLTAGVGFTGSLSGGKALTQYAAEREKPIPVFAEMGSINPVIILPNAMQQNAETIAKEYAASITLGMGQFCTNPGLIITLQHKKLPVFLQELGKQIEMSVPSAMLHKGIHQAYFSKLEKVLAQKGVNLLKQSIHVVQALDALPTVATVNASVFLENPLLHEEVFGPYSLVVQCASMDELFTVWKAVKGQLTTSIMGTDEDLANYHTIVDTAIEIAGRIVFNGVPTGVEVCPAMVHGGPYPACTDSRFTAVGIFAVKRWVRPIAFQNAPDYLLPLELKDSNPLKIWRMLNGVFTKIGF